MTEPFDFCGLMRLGLFEMKLKPRVFWSLTPYEFMTMLGRTDAAIPMVRARFEELNRAFPDSFGET